MGFQAQAGFDFYELSEGLLSNGILKSGLVKKVFAWFYLLSYMRW